MTSFQQVDGVRYLTFEIFPKNLIHAVFTRQGGLSPEPWAALNLGQGVGDERERVWENRDRAFAALGRQRESLFDVWQVHSADWVVANAPHPRLVEPPEYKADILLTDNPQVTLLMRFADCTPLLLYDPRKNAAALVHAGWVGTVKRVAAAAVSGLRAAYGSHPSDILAAIGPAIGPDHYEVGPNVIEQVQMVFEREAERLLPQVAGRTHFDLWQANRLILEQAGVGQIETAGLCTACHLEDWFSHRAEKGKTGRFGALIAVP
jgi:YfiH family protein